MVNNQTSQYKLFYKFFYLSGWGIFQYVRAIIQLSLPIDHPVVFLWPLFNTFIPFPNPQCCSSPQTLSANMIVFSYNWLYIISFLLEISSFWPARYHHQLILSSPLHYHHSLSHSLPPFPPQLITISQAIYVLSIHLPLCFVLHFFLAVLHVQYLV